MSTRGLHDGLDARLELDADPPAPAPIPWRPPPGKVTLTSQLGVQRRAVLQRQQGGRAGAGLPTLRLPLQVMVLEPISPRVEADLATARAYFHQHGIEVVVRGRGSLPAPAAHRLLDREERTSRELGGGDRPTAFDHSHPGSTNFGTGERTPPAATQEALDLLALRPVPGQITVFWLPIAIRSPNGSRTTGFAFDHTDLRNVPADREGIVIAPGAPADVLPHELAHLLLRAGHVDDPHNLLADGDRRVGDQLTPAQVQRMRTSEYLEGRPPISPGRALAQPSPAEDTTPGLTAAEVGTIAAHGVGGASGRLPFVDAICQSFGRHDVSDVRVAVGGAAADAAAALGAHAFATGDTIAFAREPDLHLAAHEAAHVVQQRAGVHLADGLGRAGDAYEQHADAVADAVVRGDSAEALLDQHAGAGAAGVQRAVQLRRIEASSSPESVEAVRHVISSGDFGTMRALLRAMQQVAGRRREGALDHVVCVGGGDTYDLHLTPEDSTKLQEALQDRMTALQSSAHQAAVAAGDAERAGDSEHAGGAPAAAPSPFARAFNSHFRDILPALRQADPSPSGTEDRATTFTDEELRVMFSPGQRAKLTQYFGDHVIPDHLFDGDDHGGCNAHQRIVISGHILAHGEYAPGGYSQRLHARMCGHWAQLVYHYAGVSQSAGAGEGGQFDHSGNLVLGTGDTTTRQGARRDIPEEQREGHRQFVRDAAVQLDQFDTIRPGDWLYIHTAVDTAGGDHSVVFSHWLDPRVMESNRVHYRRAITFDQTRPELGGRQHERYLGVDNTTVNGHPVYRITSITHAGADARPPETTDDVIEDDLQRDQAEVDPHVAALVGNGPAAARNLQLIMRMEQRYRGRIVVPSLMTQIRDRNRALIAQLGPDPASEGHIGRATEGQAALLTATNASDDLETLVRLNERLNVLVRNAAALTEAEAAQAARIDPQAAEHEAERRELLRQLEAIEDEISRAETVVNLETEIRHTERDRRGLDRAIEGMRRNLRQVRREEARRRLETRIHDREQRLTGIDQALADLRERLATESHAEEEGRQTTLPGRREPRSIRERRNRLQAFQRQVEGELGELEGDAARTAHPGSRDVFRGERGEGRTTGELDHVQPPLVWPEVITAGQPGAAQEADRARRDAEQAARAQRRAERRAARRRAGDAT